MRRFLALMLAATGAFGAAWAAEPATPPAVAYDAALAQRTGADERGMRRYVLVILRTGPTPGEGCGCTQGHVRRPHGQHPAAGEGGQAGAGRALR